MVSQQEARQKVAELIRKFSADRERGQSEADVRAGYIDLLFQALGWNVYNDPGQATNYRREGYVRDAGFVDVGLEIRVQPVLFLEAKRFGLIPHSSQRTGDRTTEEKQAFRYARSKRITHAILTNFERLHLFNADHERLIVAFDNPQAYLNRFEELWRLSPGEVERGSLPWWEGQLEKKDVDLAFLAALHRWRLLLAWAIYDHNRTNPALLKDGAFDFERLMQAVQRILDRLILIRYGDDKEVLLEHDLLEKMLAEYQGRGAYARPDHLMRAFVDLCQMMDEHHNTTLFAPEHVCERVTLPNEPLAQVIAEMNNISFRKFTADILGNTYESYLGTKLVLRNGQIQDEERRDIRKGRGIYYTPRWVVEYIVGQTLGRRLKELEEEHSLQAIEQVRGLAVLDPACGSGSFLIYAYQVLAEFYKRLNQSIAQEQARLLAEAAQFRLFETLEEIRHLPQPVLDYPQVILKEHLFGVDLDPEAAEIAAVNLTMQAFADSRQKRLPLILNENIKVGNSLISGSPEELKRYFGDAWQEKRPFNWEQEFPDITERGGFDVVIGNPPYVRSGSLPPSEKEFYTKSFISAFKQYDIYILFIEAGIRLLKDGGRLGFIVSSKFFASDYGERLRKLILDTCAIENVVNVSELPVFKEVAVYPYILVLRKDDDEDKRNESLIEVIHQLRSEQDFALGKYGVYSLPQTRFLEPPYILDVTSPAPDIVERLRSTNITLASICTVTRGFRPPPIDLLIEEKEFLHFSKAEQGEYFRMVDGKDIKGPYMLSWKGVYVKYEASRIPEAKPKTVFESPKIMITDISYHPEAYFDRAGFYCLKTIYLILLKEPTDYDLRYVTGLINSELSSFFFRSRFFAMHIRGGYLRFRKQFLDQFPIRRIDFSNPEEKARHDRLVVLVERMLELHRQLSAKKPALSAVRETVHDEERAEIERHIVQTDKEIDTLVYDLYGLTQEERRLVDEAAKGLNRDSEGQRAG